MRRDYVTHTEADAGRFERMFGEEHDDQPDVDFRDVESCCWCLGRRAHTYNAARCQAGAA